MILLLLTPLFVQRMHVDVNYECILISTFVRGGPRCQTGFCRDICNIV